MRQHDHLSALHPGARLQTYTIASLLGAGGFGITYKAVEDITNRDVAIKEYLPTAFALRDPDGTTVRPLSEGAVRDFKWGLERFREEAKLLIGFRHPNIVPVLAYFEANGTGYIVMAFQEGISLGEALKRTPTLSGAETLRYVVPLLDGVEEVHRHNVLHRDIKPDNIFIGGDGSPVLLDFGAARHALGEHSKAFTTLVTEGFAPFEQYAGTGNQGPWSDIYALAAVMFRCLTGKVPVEAPRRAIAKLRGIPDPMAQDFADLRASVPPDLAFAIEAAMRVVEHERPQSIAAFRDLIVAPAPSAIASPADQAAAAAPQPTLIPDAAFRLPAGAPPQRFAAARKPRRLVYFAAAGALLAAVASGAAYVGDQSSWLPDLAHRTEPHAANAEPAKPPPSQDALGADGEKQRAERQAADEQRAKGLAEHQRLQIEQTEAEWRQGFEARKAAARKPDEAGAAPGKPAPDRDAARRDGDRERLDEESKRRDGARPPQRVPGPREDEEQRRVDEEPAPADTDREKAPGAPPERRTPPPTDLRVPPPPEAPGRTPRAGSDIHYEDEY